MTEDPQRDRETLEPPKDTWRPPAPAAPLTTQEPDVSGRPKQVVDFGTGGLDLAYQVMHGYDGLLMIDVSRQGGSPGTLYVMETARELLTDEACASV